MSGATNDHISLHQHIFFRRQLTIGKTKPVQRQIRMRGKERRMEQERARMRERERAQEDKS